MQLGASNGKPTISSSDLSADLGDFSLGCSGISGAVINVVEDVFKDTIVNLIGSAATSALNQVVEQGNQALSKLNMDIPITDSYALVRFDLTSAPAVVGSSSVTAKLLLDVVPAKNPSLVAPFPKPSLPGFVSSSGGYMQVAFSQYSLESAGYTYFVGGRLDRVITQGDLPPNFPIKVCIVQLRVVVYFGDPVLSQPSSLS